MGYRQGGGGRERGGMEGCVGEGGKGVRKGEVGEE